AASRSVRRCGPLAVTASRAPRDRHSCPARRSSDLLAGFVRKHGSDLLQRQSRFGRRSRSILCLRFTAEYLRQPVNGIRNSSGSTAKFFDGLRHIAHSAHVIFLLPWICSAGVRCSCCLPVFLTPC